MPGVSKDAQLISGSAELCCQRNKTSLLFLQASYDLELAQHYMWAQTEQCVFLAVYLPTGERIMPQVWKHGVRQHQQPAELERSSREA